MPQQVLECARLPWPGEGGERLAGCLLRKTGEPVGGGVPHADLARRVQRHDGYGSRTNQGGKLGVEALQLLVCGVEVIGALGHALVKLGVERAQRRFGVLELGDIDIDAHRAAISGAVLGLADHPAIAHAVFRRLAGIAEIGEFFSDPFFRPAPSLRLAAKLGAAQQQRCQSYALHGNVGDFRIDLTVFLVGLHQKLSGIESGKSLIQGFHRIDQVLAFSSESFAGGFAGALGLADRAAHGVDVDGEFADLVLAEHGQFCHVIIGGDAVNVADHAAHRGENAPDGGGTEHAHPDSAAQHQRQEHRKLK